MNNQKIVVGDVLNVEAVQDVVNKADYVFHLASLADLNAARTRPAETVQTNIMGTVNFLEAARRAGVKRFMFASTVYVYSREGGFYRCSKQACENYIEEYGRHFGIKYTILRYGSLYGPRADESNGVYRLLLQALTSGEIQFPGSPDDIREYIHVEDAAGLSVDALNAGYVNQHLVITGHYAMRISDLFTMFSEIIGRPLEINYKRPDIGKTNGHYSVTPYTFSPKPGRKLSANHYVDMGQGILQVIEQLYCEGGLQQKTMSAGKG
jgi:UDP-glucose 4-epimerase